VLAGLRRFLHLLLIRGVKIEVYAAQRPLTFSLAQDDGHLFIEGNTMAQLGSAILVSLDCLLHQGPKGALAVLRRLIEADNVLLVGLDCLRNLMLERVDRHDLKLEASRSNFKVEIRGSHVEEDGQGSKTRTR
jgi:hypothetical protein